jgi:hypothetical protein
MRKFDTIVHGDELYEIIRRCPVSHFKSEIDGEHAKLLTEWMGCERILISKEKNQYLFVSLIEKADIVNYM